MRKMSKRGAVLLALIAIGIVALILAMLNIFGVTSPVRADEDADGDATDTEKTIYVVGESKEDADNGTYYTSLVDAVNAAASGDEIVLETDLSYTSQVTIDKDITLNLNGYSLTLSYTSGDQLVIKGSVIITGTENEESGSENPNTIISTKCIYLSNTIEVADYLKICSGVTVYSTDAEALVYVAGGTFDLYGTLNTTASTSFTIYALGGTANIYDGASVSGVTDGIYADAYISDIAVNIYGGTITATGECGICALPYQDPEGNKVTVNISDGVITGGYYGISTNGSMTNDVEINISGGKTSATSSAGTGIYLPSPKNTVVISGNAEISGSNSGIEIRAGSLTISGGTIISTDESFSTKEGGSTSGNTVSGAALAISQHTSAADISVTITGGTFSGVYAVYEANVQGNDPSANVEITIADGIFNGDVSAEDDSEFISGGTYSVLPQEEYFMYGYLVPDVDENGNYVVGMGFVNQLYYDDGGLAIEGWSYGEQASTPYGVTSKYGAVQYLYAILDEGGEYTEWTAKVPADAGTYYVKAYVPAGTLPTQVNGEFEDLPYEAVESDPVEFKIAPGTNSVAVLMNGWTYGEEASSPTYVAAHDGTAAYTYFYDEDCTDEIAEADLSVLDPGTYFVQVTLTAANYETATAVASFTVAKAQSTFTATGATEEAMQKTINTLMGTIASSVLALGVIVALVVIIAAAIKRR